MKKLIMKFDGSCTDTKRDGDLGIGVHGYYEGNEEGSLFKVSESAGIGTNNEAEYFALIKGLKILVHNNLTTNVEVIGDSEVVIKQMTGEYKCKDYHLVKLFMEAKSLAEKFTNISFKHITREHNELADKLSKENVKKTLTDYYNYRF